MSGARSSRTAPPWKFARLAVARGVLDVGRMKHNPTFDLGDGITIEQVPEGVDPHAFLQAAMDDCPLCQEARARGETPTIIEVPPPRPRSNPFARPPRWRTRK